jgi:DNA-nicking Smr family endonuclease
MAARARVLTELETAEWARFASRISPLPGRRALVSAAVAPSEPVPSPERRAPSSGPAPKARHAPLGIGGQPAGVDSATWQRFQRGQMGGTRKLDLHGMTAHHAFQALRSFLRVCHADHVRCVEIVTGRGGLENTGVLRRELPIWLNLPEIRPMVLAASHPHSSSAMHARMTNPGSVRLLLRRPRA